jgi:putative restriction endonuclease
VHVTNIPMRFWWVNQNQTFKHEVAGGYLWSPKRRADNARHYFYETMREVSPGDLVFSFSDTLIPAIGIATSFAEPGHKPPEFGNAGMNWNQWGWRVNVDFRMLVNRIRPKDHMQLLAPVLPAKYAPLQQSGNGNQGVYLTEVPAAMALVLVDLIGDEARQLLTQNQHMAAERAAVYGPGAHDGLGVAREYEEIQESAILGDSSLLDTELWALVRARIGQGKFRQQVSAIESGCRITRVTNPIHLIARHIKPWRDSNNTERLDGENGLLLTPSIDHLFGRGFISFTNNGKLISAPVADADSLKKMGIPLGQETHTGQFTRKQQEYLEYYRDEILKQRAVG